MCLGGDPRTRQQGSRDAASKGVTSSQWPLRASGALARWTTQSQGRRALEFSQ